VKIVEWLAGLWTEPSRQILWGKQPLALLILAVITGCSTVPRGQASVDRIRFKGESALSERELKKLLATKQTRKFGGLVRGVFFEHSLYNHFVLQMDIQRVERIYRAHGYYHARVLSSRIHFTDNDHVRVVIEVDEGEPTRIKSVTFTGLPEVSESKKKRLQSAVERRASAPDPFTEDTFEKAADRLLFTLRDLGFARAEV
jgi:outer membrane protein assembly factor BamA